MMRYIATFYSHYGAIQYRKNCEKLNLEAVIMPVPRELSSSCGTCVRFETEGEFPEKMRKLSRSSGSRLRDMCVCITQMRNNSIEELLKLEGAF